jgi:hypothetical protein
LAEQRLGGRTHRGRGVDALGTDGLPGAFEEQWIVQDHLLDADEVDDLAVGPCRRLPLHCGELCLRFAQSVRDAIDLARNFSLLDVLGRAGRSGPRDNTKTRPRAIPRASEIPLRKLSLRIRLPHCRRIRASRPRENVRRRVGKQGGVLNRHRIRAVLARRHVPERTRRSATDMIRASSREDARRRL